MLKEPCEIIWAKRILYREKWCTESHKHNCFHMISVLSGNCSFSINNMAFNLSEGDIFIARPGRMHGVLELEKPAELFEIKFKVDEPDALNELEHLPPVISLSNDILKSIFDSIQRYYDEASFGYKWMMNVKLSSLLNELIKMFDCDIDSQDEEKGGRSRMVAQIEEYIEKNFADELSLENIARALGYNKNYILGVFKKEIGDTISNYIYEYRIKQSKELLRNADLSIEQVSLLTGFKSVHHFYRIFKKHSGIPPGQYVKANRDIQA